MPFGKLLDASLGKRPRHRRDSLQIVTEAPAGDPRSAFEAMLNAALVGGRTPAASTILGAQTWAAVDAVARAHPDATVEEIAVAYDAFAREHGVYPTAE